MSQAPGIDPALYPFTGHLHRLASGHRLHYLDEGTADAAPVVMVHGNPTWSFYYRNLVLGLRDRHRCLVPDHVGMGLSDRPGDADYSYTLARRVEDFGEWLTAVEPTRALDLVVHDWGGAIGMAWAAAHPERIRRIVILNTWAFTIPDDVALPRSLSFARTALGAWLIQRFNAFSGLAVRMATASRLEPAVARGLVAPYQGSPDRRLATLRFVQDIPLQPSDPAWAVLEQTESRLETLRGKPVLIGWGSKDFVFDDRVLARWREIFPEAELEYLKQAGHYVLEDAADQLVPKIAAFLND
ncbi:MAG: alpha/beta hydrolase [Gammaproteobacteria bacterium HGW-Gammaproteobacteria-8]|nr:MAG: alpha/beta hydrolase [Gammaproteobacteria bacterium HGW-Gammaproteobacteria-8]